MRHHAKCYADRSNGCRDIGYCNFNFLGCRPPPSWISLNFKFVTDRTVTRAELRHPAKFRWNRWNSGRDMAIFRFFKMAEAAVLDFWTYKFLTVGRIVSVELLHHAKFRGDRSNNGRDILILDFLRRRLSPSWIFEISKEGQEVRTASACQISSKLIKPRPRYGDFSIFRDGGRRHLGFLKF